MNNKLTDERVSNATLIRLIQWADQHNSHYVAAALCELQERRKADNQEPAGYHVIKECGKVGCSVATLEEAEKTRDFWNKKWTIRPYFYSAAPAPVVPEEITADGIIGMHECGFVEGWNACRAAMLQAGNHTEQHLDMVDHSGDANEKGSDGTFIDEGTKQACNSPVIPGGWISCSERMPEQGAYISAVSKHGEYVAGQVIDDWLDLHDGTSFGLDEVYLWMMLPPLLASPQQ
ncbi:DUF551 domain-containing protein [Salmonella enterica]